VLAAVLAVLVAMLLAPGSAQAPAHRALLTSAPPTPPAARVQTRPLAGVTIALDPGHQLGNGRFPRQIGRLVPAGGFRKPCNTTGTATNGGYPEATFAFAVARLVRSRLQALGATVPMTRTTNRADRWGPCVDARGRFGGRVHARLMVSLHGDGAAARAHGFHVIAPTRRSPWTTRTARPSLRLAKALRAGLDGRHVPRSTYVGGGTALSIRPDLGTLNLSTVPVAMVELGNMRNRADAHRMTTRAGRATYAAALVAGIRRYLGR
jgi:N-acetylmuramoyl-L-alanine amidase